MRPGVEYRLTVQFLQKGERKGKLSLLALGGNTSTSYPCHLSCRYRLQRAVVYAIEQSDDGEKPTYPSNAYKMGWMDCLKKFLRWSSARKK